MSKRGKTVSVRAGRLEFVKLNVSKFELRDTYHLILTLSWPRFAAVVLAGYLLINVFFAILYLLGGRCIAELPPGSFPEAFFFSVETFATVGYGHMYPDTVYGHCVATVEIMVGLFGMAVITGLIFVRFSRPTARILFSKCAVIAPFDRVPTLMLRARAGEGAHRSDRARRLHYVNELSFHSLRRTATTLLHEAGVPPSVAQALIGHDSCIDSGRDCKRRRKE